MFETAAVSALDEETITLLDHDAAETAYDILQSHEAAASILGRSLDPIRGFLALSLGRLDEAERHFEQGMSLAEHAEVAPDVVDYDAPATTGPTWLNAFLPQTSRASGTGSGGVRESPVVVTTESEH